MCDLFGYVEPDKAQLRLWEYEQYRAVYCGLCRSMGRHTGTLSRLTLNYDYVFLAMLRSALLGITPSFAPSRCAIHPLKRQAIASDDEALRYCAEVSLLLTYHKMLDDIADSRGAKRLASSLARPFCALSLRRLKGYDALCKHIKEKLDRMAMLEREHCKSPDECAELFGEIMSELLAHGLDDEKTRRIARELGRSVGRYIYLADALDDMDEDEKNGDYNPFLEMYGKDAPTHLDRIKTAVLLELTRLEAALALVDFSTCPGYGNIVNNIIYSGMPQKTDALAKRYTNAAGRSKGNDIV